jgi:capsular polysaccharide biosynthesis protein
MSAKYYTQFILTDAQYRDGNEFCGVVELSQPMEQHSDERDIEAILASNFDLKQSAVKLVSWSRLH